MPLVPLFDETTPPEASHQVRAPGGYESWRIIAFDQAQDLLLYAAAHEGCLSDPAYARALRRYLRNPTRILPPLPQDYCCEELAVYHRAKRIAHSFTRISSAPSSISNSAEFRVGQCTLTLDPIVPPTFLDQTTLNSSHHWIFSNPLARLHGELHLSFHHFNIDSALACRDHRYGPARPNSSHFIDGVACLADSALFFQATPTTSWIIHARPDGIQLIDQPLTIESTSRSLFTPYPLSISLPSWATLSNPRIMHRSLSHLRLIYEVKSPASKELAQAFCEISYPARLSCPFISLFAPRPKCGQAILTAASQSA
jgi:hypothetical protein